MDKDFSVGDGFRLGIGFLLAQAAAVAFAAVGLVVVWIVTSGAILLAVLESLP